MKTRLLALVALLVLAPLAAVRGDDRSVAIALLRRVVREYEYIEQYDEIFYSRDYWQLPDDTRKYREGDCEDLALLLLEELWIRGIDAEILIIEVGDALLHAVVRVDDIILDPSTGYVLENPVELYLRVLSILEYEEIMSVLLRTREHQGVWK